MESRDQDELDLLTARSLLSEMASSASPQMLAFAKALAEFEDWLADDRQWLQGGATHWGSLMDDLRVSLAFLATMASPPIQAALDGHV